MFISELLLLTILDSISTKDILLGFLALGAIFYLFKVGIPQKISEGYKELAEVRGQELKENEKTLKANKEKIDFLEKEVDALRRDSYLRKEFQEKAHSEYLELERKYKEVLLKLGHKNGSES